MAADALKVVSALSTPFIEAGTPFTITTTVTNVHEEKVDVLSYNFFIPYQVQWIHDNNFDTAYQKLQERTLFSRMFRRTPWKQAAQPPGQVMTFASINDANAPVTTILPGESANYSFKALVTSWLFTTGAQIAFEGIVTYLYQGEQHKSQFRVNFTLRPPLKANIIGAIFGGVLGTTAKYLKDITTVPDAKFDVSFYSAAALAVILGIVMVVYSSRRSSEVQPILTVEDIWGGMLTGFLVGYLGHDFFGKVVNIGT